MAEFVPVGKTYLYLDRIDSVEVVPGLDGQFTCKVQFAGGGCRQLSGAEAQALFDFLLAHVAR